MQYTSLIALKQKLSASAALSAQEIDCFSVPVAVDKCEVRDPPHSDSNSEGCFRAPVPHRHTQQSSAYNQAVEIGSQPLAHNPTSDLTVTPGEKKLHTYTQLLWLQLGSICIQLFLGQCLHSKRSKSSKLFPSLKIAAVKEKADSSQSVTIIIIIIKTKPYNKPTGIHINKF